MDLPITIATWDYDRVRPLVDGRVEVEGCKINYLVPPPEECFYRAYVLHEFEVSEIGFGPYLIAYALKQNPYVALPVFLSRMFRHSAIYVRTDRGIRTPADLESKTIGVVEYQMSAAMWCRGMLADVLSSEHVITWGFRTSELAEKNIGYFVFDKRLTFFIEFKPSCKSRSLHILQQKLQYNINSTFKLETGLSKSRLHGFQGLP